MKAKLYRDNEDKRSSAYCPAHGWMAEGPVRLVRGEMFAHNYKYHSSSYGYLMRAAWHDAEPERLSVDLKVSEDLEPFVVFTTSSAWMDKDQVTEIRDYLNKCLEEMNKF